jgi:hypothetical protein
MADAILSTSSKVLFIGWDPNLTEPKCAASDLQCALTDILFASLVPPTRARPGF